jgi:hyaluronate lyase
VKPSDATYAYIQMPGADQATTAAMAEAPDVAVIANTDLVQAVSRSSGGAAGSGVAASGDGVSASVARLAATDAPSGDGVVMANFWSATAPKTAGIQVDKPVSVVASRQGDQLAIAVSDPTKAQTDTITVTVDGSAGSVVAVDPGVTVVATSPNIVISVPLSGAAGKSFTARFDLSAAPGSGDGGDGSGDGGSGGSGSGTPSGTAGPATAISGVASFTG